MGRIVLLSNRRAIANGGIAALVVAMIVTSGCTAKKSHADRTDPPLPFASFGSPGSNVSASKIAVPVVPLAVVRTNPDAGATGVDLVLPIKATVSGGSLKAVRLTNPEGKILKGTLAPNRLTWASAEPLGYDRQYTITAIATNASGKDTTKISSFRTLTADTLTMPHIKAQSGYSFEAGATYGVGQVIAVSFDESIEDRKAAQKALTVTSIPPQPGAWNWISPYEVRWRPEEYWKPGTKISVSAKMYGKKVGPGLYGQQDVSTSFKIGARHISVADDKTKIITVYSDGKVVRRIPTSMGRHVHIKGVGGKDISLFTNSGPHIVIGGEQKIKMTSASFGLAKNSPYGYETHVPVGVKISNDGEYVHWADWSLDAQGNTDTSHGCLNISPDNAWWFYAFSRPGDIVDVRNTGQWLTPDNSGDWVVPWAKWVSGGAT
jgi:lipoprotein-anchoring transpeptidase ErfK/SrfK